MKNNIKFFFFLLTVGVSYFITGKSLLFLTEKYGLCQEAQGPFSRQGFADCPGKYFIVEIVVEVLPYATALIIGVLYILTFVRLKGTLKN